MLSLSAGCRYFFYRPETDMRKGFDGLSGIVRNALNKDPLAGDIFIFANRRRNQVKLLLFEGDGFAVYHKRLERGTYEIPDATEDHVVLRMTSFNSFFKGYCSAVCVIEKDFKFTKEK